jgi:hypothetical protein
VPPIYLNENNYYGTTTHGVAAKHAAEKQRPEFPFGLLGVFYILFFRPPTRKKG